MDIINAPGMDDHHINIFDNMDYMDLKNFALSNKTNLSQVRIYLKHKEIIARKILNGDIVDDMSIRDLVERVYHLNGYQSGDATDIIIDGERWTKGKNTILTNDTTSSWKVNNKRSRVDGPAFTNYNYNGQKEMENVIV
uniref:Uncharacterized protein n=1 Tax=viral metagenome TaxID=1070528 RepID=A0A6C0J967_9ZZZZ